MRSILYMAAVAPTTFPRFMDLPNEILEIIWHFVLTPPRESRRILKIGLPYVCENGERYQQEDSLCIASRLKLVSKHTHEQITTVSSLLGLFSCLSPSHHRLEIKFPGVRREYLRSDTQQDIFYLDLPFIRYRLSANRRIARREHTGWNEQPSSRPAHVMFNLTDLTDMLGWTELRPRGFFSFFGVSLLRRDQQVSSIYRNLSMNFALRKVTVIVRTGATETFDGSNATYSELERIPFDLTVPDREMCNRVFPEGPLQYVLYWMVSHWRAMCTDALIDGSIQMPELEFARV